MIANPVVLKSAGCIARAKLSVDCAEHIRGNVMRAKTAKTGTRSLIEAEYRSDSDCER